MACSSTLSPSPSRSLDLACSSTLSTSRDTVSCPRPNVPTSEQHLSTGYSEEQDQLPSQPRLKWSAGTSAPSLAEQLRDSTSSEERGQGSSLNAAKRTAPSTVTQDRPHSSKSKGQSQLVQSPGRDSVHARTDEQTRQMIKATEELRKLGDILDSCSSCEVGNHECDSRAMHLRRRILVQQDVVDSFERELVYVNRAIWDYPPSTPECKSGEVYSEEIRAVLRRVLDPQQRFRTFQRMLMTLERPPSEAEPSEDARKERVRQLKLVLQDVIFDPAALEGLHNEARSNSTPMMVAWLRVGQSALHLTAGGPSSRSGHYRYLGNCITGSLLTRADPVFVSLSEGLDGG